MATNPPSVDIRDYITSQGANGSWQVNISRSMDSPNQLITIYDNGGTDPNPKWLLDLMDVQIRVRGDRNGYSAAYSRCQTIKDTLLGSVPGTINGTDYIAVYMRGDVNFIQYDENERPIFTMNYQIYRQPTSGVREPTT